MDAQAVQALLARVLATSPSFQSPAVWGSVPGQTPAASSAASSSAYGFPGQGANANVTPGDAAQAYAAMLQLSEQCRLAAVAESMLTPTTSDEQFAQRVREAVRQELAASSVSQEKPELPRKADRDDGVAEATLQHNKDEAKLDQERREYEADRLKETREYDRRAIDFARAAHKKECEELQADAAKDKSYMAPKPKRRPQLKSVGGYRVAGGVLEVFTRFRPEREDVPDKTDKNDKSSSRKNADDAPQKTSQEPEQKPEQKRVKEAGKKDDGKLRPCSPDYPPAGRDKRPYGVNPPPPPVDIYKKEKEYLDS